MADTRAIAPLKDLLNSDYAKGRFKEVLGEKSAAFLASVLNATRVNPALAECDPKSVLSAAMAAATLDLPIDGSLGFAAIVPYRNKGKVVAQFQIMTKGFVQLALRTGQYKAIHVGPVYADEYHGENPITGDVQIQAVRDGFRDKMDDSKIVGYVAFFRLVNGYECTRFWTLDAIRAHGKRYSKSYDSEYGLWKTNFPAMAQKTVLKNTLAKWGILSTTMQMAVKTDQAAILDTGRTIEEADIDYVDGTDAPEEETVPARPAEEVVKAAAPVDGQESTNLFGEKEAPEKPKLAEIKTALFDYLESDIPDVIKGEIDLTLKNHPTDTMKLSAILEKAKTAYGRKGK